MLERPSKPYHLEIRFDESILHKCKELPSASSTSTGLECVDLYQFTQERCQQIATEIAAILENHGEWDVLAADGSYHRLNMLSKNLGVLKAHHDLMFSTLSLVPVLLRKPAEHESPGSIIIPAFSEEWTIQFTATQWAEYEALEKRQEIAYAAAREMDRWCKECASSFDVVQESLRSMQEHLKELLDYQTSSEMFRGRISLSSPLEELPDSEDDVSTQSTMDIMTPTKDWSEVGSDTTEIGRRPSITRHSLQLCEYATASFLRLLEDIYQDMVQRRCTPLVGERLQHLHKAYSELFVHLLHALDAPVPFQDYPARSPSVQIQVTEGNLFTCVQETKDFLERNNATERSFSDLPGATPVDAADIEAMHKAYGTLVRSLCCHLVAPIPFQNDCPISGPDSSTASVSASDPSPEVPKAAMAAEEQEESHVVKALEAIIESMETTPTEKDIMKLVFHWTTLNECNGSTRADVMKLN